MDAQDADKQRFDTAVGVARLTTGLSNDDKLRMYGLFKQAAGETLGERPGIFNVTGRAKWDAWDKVSSLSANDARQQYCDLVEALAAGHAAAA
mmetsp:Transcript_25949/g.64406  ORF Transcript_25949/g.64406 Transcript_25949/m.64406 type:complete len:93 (+) Transcript_25949:72-350(+)